MLKMLFPARCPVCDSVVAGNTNICGKCVGIPRIVPRERCMKCSKHIDNPLEEFCSDCKNIRHFYTRGISLYEYDSVKDSINNFKNNSRPEYAEVYAEEIVKHLGKIIKDFEAEALIPIPLHKSKFNKRGYNQSALLAEEISKRTSIPVSDSLVRVKKTAEQKKLSNTERQKNLVGAFHMSEKGVKLKRVILVDDVYTTGATLDEAAKVLLDEGVKKIYFLTVAIGIDD